MQSSVIRWLPFVAMVAGQALVPPPPPPTPTKPTCLESPRDTSLLQKLLGLVRHGDSGTLTILAKGWSSHKLGAAIGRIIIEELLAHKVVISNEFPSTPGSYEAISKDHANVDFEMWSTSALTEYQAFSDQLHDAGPTFDFARSGLYVRPGDEPGIAETIASLGRSYSTFNSTLLPLLPTVTEAIADCGVSQSHCVEMPNRICHFMECKALYKVTKEYDEGALSCLHTLSTTAVNGTPAAKCTFPVHLLSSRQPCRALCALRPLCAAGIIEDMIRNASLPLAIVYTGWSYPQLFARNSSRTLLFYYWVRVAGLTRPLDCGPAGLPFRAHRSLCAPQPSYQRTKALQLLPPRCPLRLLPHMAESSWLNPASRRSPTRCFLPATTS